jgi:hypothetical protein
MEERKKTEGIQNAIGPCELNHEEEIAQEQIIMKMSKYNEKKAENTQIISSDGKETRNATDIK